MITSSASLWFFVLGGITSLLALQFLVPRWYSRQFNKIELADAPSVFYAMQAGLAIAVQGGLLVWAGFDPALRVPTAALVGGGKLVFVATIFVHLRWFPGLLVSAVVDLIGVGVLGAYLLGW